MTAGRGATRQRLQSALDTGRGAVLVGAPGVGKTVMARAVARAVANEQSRIATRWVSATGSAKLVPFGAFSHLVEFTGADEPATLLRAAQHALRREADHGLMLVVDDAHHLDTLSATLVHQLALSGSVRLLLTVRDGETCPDAVTALWKDQLLARCDILPFDAEESAAILEQVLGGPVEAVSADRMYGVSQGNPLYLRHLVVAAVETGSLRQAEGVWQLRGEMTLTPELSTLVDEHLRGLAPDVRTVLEFLAIEEPLAVSDLAEMVGLDAVDRAESAGAVTVSDHGGHLVVHAFHPLYTERIRSGLGRLAVRRLRKMLVAQLSAAARTDISGRLRIAGLALDTDDPPEAGDLVALSWEAMRMGDLAFGERLARGALDQTGDLSARLPLAHSLSWQGRGKDADEVLKPVDPDTLSEWDLTAWTLPKAANRFWMLSESREAVSYLADMRARISEPAAFHTLDALAATFAMSSGDPAHAIRVATVVLESPQALDLAVAWAAATATLSSARMGSFDDVEVLARRGLGATHPGLLRFTIGFGQALSSIMAADVDSAVDLARHYAGFSEFQQPGRAIGEVVLGHVLVARGSLDEAATLFRQAAAALTATGYSWGPLALIGLAQALGQQGHSAEAAVALERAISAHGMRSELYAPELALARAWTLAAARDLRGAVAAARDAVHVAEQSGQAAVALRAVQDALRLGDVGAVVAARRINARIDCAAGRSCIEHGQALADQDAAGLDRVSVSLEEAGMLAAAADAAAQAANVHRSAGDRAGEALAKAHAAALSQRCGNPATPALEKVLNPSPLTGREKEVAVMVAQGMTNKAIAAQLSVSVRTVEGHVYKACMKLGLPDRSALATTVR
ncbi:AAA family ATPase [Mycobacterium yunnanensis]|uniref:AAA family ATPase n=1 Tax=Mycobacterium yunnanensis TaxID=368477 RepID=A0A9X2Z3M3_9MYCO|nr:LuxR family transcriptional regulator [Mycobacterium yunnanensis]MCV7422190.1 AAA family ATPase [Mycobacterium yunnanensis]